ncbi:hypothetical protein [Parabacteroides goldsteinii]|uniref:hypothetical protein n=1 Tax=Parabacteroides goldsteinii TaxID=328812 RepID=UPI001D5883C9|nr:hypothetical protein [Parabacteroides goldsteinii]MBS6574749.1 hypothetical protein [Parabacteroides goldsteinii]
MRLKELYKVDVLILLTKLDILTAIDIIEKLNIEVDDDVSGYVGRESKNYYFKNKFSFQPYSTYLIKAEILASRVYSQSLLESDVDNSNNYFCLEGKGLTENLKEIDTIDKGFFENNGCSIEAVNDFSLHKLRIRNIDNIKKDLYYEGTCYGNMLDIGDITSDWDVFSKISLLGIKNNISEFYKELLSESYMLYENENYKLSFFIAFSAFECFVNVKGNMQDEQLPLIDKITNLYKWQFPDLSNNEIFQSIMPHHNKLTDIRNKIAHGKAKVCIRKREAEQCLKHVLIMILAYENTITGIKEFYEKCGKF